MSFRCPLCDFYHLLKCPASEKYQPPASAVAALKADISKEGIPPCIKRMWPDAPGSRKAVFRACNYQWDKLKNQYLALYVAIKEYENYSRKLEKSKTDAEQAKNLANRKLSETNEETRVVINRTLTAIVKLLGEPETSEDVTGCPFIDNTYFPQNTPVVLSNSFCADNNLLFAKILGKHLEWLLAYFKVLKCVQKTPLFGNILALKGKDLKTPDGAAKTIMCSKNPPIIHSVAVFAFGNSEKYVRRLKNIFFPRDVREGIGDKRAVHIDLPYSHQSKGDISLRNFDASQIINIYFPTVPEFRYEKFDCRLVLVSQRTLEKLHHSSELHSLLEDASKETVLLPCNIQDVSLEKIKLELQNHTKLSKNVILECLNLKQAPEQDANSEILTKALCFCYQICETRRQREKTAIPGNVRLKAWKEKFPYASLYMPPNIGMVFDILDSTKLKLQPIEKYVFSVKHCFDGVFGLAVPYPPGNDITVKDAKHGCTIHFLAKMPGLPKYFFSPTSRGKMRKKKWYITPSSKNRFELTNTAHYLALAFAAWDFVVNFRFPNSVPEWTEEDIEERAKKNWRSLNAIQNRTKNRKVVNPYIYNVEEWVWKQIEKHAKMLDEVLKNKKCLVD